MADLKSIVAEKLPLTMGETIALAKEYGVRVVDVVLTESELRTGLDREGVLKAVMEEYAHNLKAVEIGVSGGNSFLLGTVPTQLKEMGPGTIFSDVLLDKALMYTVAAEVGNHCIGVRPCAGTGDPCPYTGFLRALMDVGTDETTLAEVACLMLKVGSLFRVAKVTTGCNLEGYGAGSAAIAAATVHLKNGTPEQMEKAMVLAMSPTIGVPCTPRVLVPALCTAHVGGAILGGISGLLKSYCNVNEVISGIMLNWIVLYLTNMLLTTVKEDASPYTKVLAHINESAVLPSLGLGALFNNNQYVGLAIPLSVLMAILVWVVLEKTKFGYELKATGYNKNAAKYCGMAEKRNIILSLMISGALAGMGAAMLYLTGYEQWQCSTSSVPAMGFNGIAAAFLGGLNPIGTVLASFFIQHITAGGAYVDKSMYCAQISDLISALIIYLCGFVLFMKHAMNSYAAKREEKVALKARAAEAQARAEAGKGGDQ